MSLTDVVSASTAMISLATVMSNPVSRELPSSAAPFPIVMRRRWRSHVSTTRCHVMVAGSIDSRQNRARWSGVIASGSVRSDHPCTTITTSTTTTNNNTLTTTRHQ